MYRGEKGFTLVELVIVMVIIGILAAVAIPKFVNLAAQAKVAACKGALGGVRSGIAIEYANYAATHDGSTLWVPLANVPNIMAQGVPPNPYNNSTNVVAGTVKGAAGTSAGWVYNTSNGDFWAATTTVGENAW